MVKLIVAIAIAWAVVLCFCVYMDAAQQGDEWEDEEQW